MKFHTKIWESFKPQSFRNSLFPAFVAALLLASGAAQALPMYTITDLGDLPGGGTASLAADINNSGQVVGSSHATGGQHATLWHGGLVTDLGTLGGAYGSETFSHALAINNSGQVTGYSVFGTDGQNRAFLWDNVNGMTDLGTLRDGSAAHGINDSGQVVGISGATTGSRAFLWNPGPDGGMTDLGSLLPGTYSGFDYSRASDINNSGQVVGSSVSTVGGRSERAVLWQDGTITDLGALSDEYDRSSSSASSINDSGQIVGASDVSPFNHHAVLWQNGSITDLGSLTDGHYSYAVDINNSGQVVGTSDAEEGSRAFLWDDSHGMLDLNDLLVDGDHWRLLNAQAINDSGQIVGYGRHSGITRGFLLTPVDAGPETGAIAPGVLPGSILDAVAENKTTMQPGLFQSFSDSGFIDGVDGFDPAKETYVLVHGWNGEGSYGTGDQKNSLDPLWVTGVANEIKQKDPNANILAWNWTQFADSHAQDEKVDMLKCLADIGSGDCAIVPVSEVAFQSRYLAQTFGELYSGFGDEAGGVQFLGHSLGAAIAANAVNFLPSPAPEIDRLTLFDPPENSSAIKIGGKVNLDTVLPGIIRNSSGTVIENYTADGVAGDPITGYGESYADVANTLLLRYTHFNIAGRETPMDWYEPTVHPGGDCNVDCRERGLGESKSDLQDRYGQTWANLIPFAPYILSRVDELVERATKVVLESWHDLKDWGTKVIVDAAQYIADVTETLIGKLGSAIASLADGVTAGVSELADWASTGVASFIEGLGLQLTSHSPSYAYTTLHVPDNADSIYFEFMPQVWALDDAYIILFDDDVLYRIDGEFFENAWMDTGFLDVSRWAGQDVQLTIGLLSDEAGHQITTGGFGFTSRVAVSVNSVPEPGILLLLVTGLLGLIGLRYATAWQAGMRRKWAA